MPRGIGLGAWWATLFAVGVADADQVWGVWKMQAPLVATFESMGSDATTFAFVEAKQITLLADLSVDQLAATGQPGVISAGTIVNSYMIIAANTPYGYKPGHRARVEFEQPILGIIYEDQALTDTDAFLGHSGTDYLSNSGIDRSRGLETRRRHVSDEVRIDTVANTVDVRIRSYNAADEIRVITLVPEPVSSACVGLAGLWLMRRRD